MYLYCIYELNEMKGVRTELVIVSLTHHVLTCVGNKVTFTHTHTPLSSILVAFAASQIGYHEEI